jgi:hypothetical protein
VVRCQVMGLLVSQMSRDYSTSAGYIILALHDVMYEIYIFKIFFKKVSTDNRFTYCALPFPGSMNVRQTADDAQYSCMYLTIQFI